jgi:hypothetical protein
MKAVVRTSAKVRSCVRSWRGFIPPREPKMADMVRGRFERFEVCEAVSAMELPVDVMA